MSKYWISKSTLQKSLKIAFLQILVINTTNNESLSKQADLNELIKTNQPTNQPTNQMKFSPWRISPSSSFFFSFFVVPFAFFSSIFKWSFEFTKINHWLFRRKTMTKRYRESFQARNFRYHIYLPTSHFGGFVVLKLVSRCHYVVSFWYNRVIITLVN